MPKGPVTEGVRGSGSGRTNAQDFMVAGGGSLFCRLLCLSLSLVHVSRSVLWLCPKPTRAPAGYVAARFPSPFGSGDSLPVRTSPSHFHGTVLRFWWLFPAICSAERMKTETGYSSPSNIILPFLYEGQLLLLTLLKHIISSLAEQTCYRSRALPTVNTNDQFNGQVPLQQFLVSGRK